MIRFCTKLVVAVVLTAIFSVSHTAIASDDFLSMVEKECISFKGGVGIGNFSPDGQYVLTASEQDHDVKVFGHDDQDNWVERGTFTHDGLIWTAIFSPDGLNILTASVEITDNFASGEITQNAEVKIGSIDERGYWNEINKITLQSKLESAKFTAKGQYLSITSLGGQVIILEKGEGATWSEKGNFENQDAENKPECVNIAEITPDTNYLVTCGVDGCVKIRKKDKYGKWNEGTVAEFKFEDTIESINFSPNSRYVAVNGMDGKAVILSKDVDGNWSKTTDIFGEETYSILFSPDGHYALTIINKVKATIWGETDDGTWRSKGDFTLNGVARTVIFSLDSHHALIQDQFSRRVQILGRDKSGEWKLIGTICHTDKIATAIFSDDSRHVATASNDGTAEIWSQCKNGSWNQKNILSHDAEVCSVNFSHNNERVVTVSLDSKVKIWENDAASKEYGELLASVSQEDCVYLLATFGKNCNTVLTCSGSGNDLNHAQIWVLKHNDTSTILAEKLKQMSMNSTEGVAKKKNIASCTCSVM